MSSPNNYRNSITRDDLHRRFNRILRIHMRANLRREILELRSIIMNNVPEENEDWEFDFVRENEDEGRDENQAVQEVPRNEDIPASLGIIFNDDDSATCLVCGFNWDGYAQHRCDYQ